MKCYQLCLFLISIFFSVFCGMKWMGVPVSCNLHQSFTKLQSCSLTPVIQHNLQVVAKQYSFQTEISDPPAALSLVPGHPHALVPPLVPLWTLRSLGKALHIYILCHLFAIFFQTVSRSDAIIPLFLVMPHTAHSPTLVEVTNNYCRPWKTVLWARFTLMCNKAIISTHNTYTVYSRI